jgi:hypothetical protein
MAKHDEIPRSILALGHCAETTRALGNHHDRRGCQMDQLARLLTPSARSNTMQTARVLYLHVAVAKDDDRHVRLDEGCCGCGRGAG